MKKYIVLAILTVSFLACKGTKKATSVNKNSNSISAVGNDENKDALKSKSQKKATTSARSKKKDTTNSETTNTATTSVTGSIVSQTNGSTGAMDDAQMSTTVSSAVSEKDLDKMYKDLQMTDSQIFSFNNSMREYKQAVKSTSHGEMLGTEGNEQERQLKDILTDNQWNKYLTWKKNRK